MVLRTVQPADYETYLEYQYPAAEVGAEEARAADQEARRGRLAAFPFMVVLQVAYAELDYADRWCWQQFGPAHGECQQRDSEYPACGLPHPHSHLGSWMTHWLVKIDYNFGFNEWYFQRQADQDLFLEFVPHLHWGELYPK